MAKYIVVRVDKNETADELLKRFSVVPAISVVGVFASSSTHCPGPEVCGPDRKYIRSRQWGTTHCSVCKKPVTSCMQHPRNLLNDIDLHPRFNDIHFAVWEPYKPPEEQYGVDSINRKKAQVEQGKNRMKRYKAKKRREEREANGG